MRFSDDSHDVIKNNSQLDECLVSYSIYVPDEKSSDTYIKHEAHTSVVHELSFDKTQDDVPTTKNFPIEHTGKLESNGITNLLSSSFDLMRHNYLLPIVQHRAFNRIILIIILANTIIMSLADYTNVDSKNNLLENGSIRNAVLIRSELFFVVSFAVEMLIKMFALGTKVLNLIVLNID